MKIKGIEQFVKPSEVAGMILGSMEKDFLHWRPEPTAPNVGVIAKWGRALGLEARARRSYRAAARLEARKGNKGAAAEYSAKASRLGALPSKDVEAWLSSRVSPWPDRWGAVVDGCKEMEAKGLFREAERLDACGSAWGRIVRLFWKDSKGREVVKSYGVHRCKSRFCPFCGRVKTKTRAEEIEKVLEIAGEWGLEASNVRFLTLTVKNSADIPSAREKAHHAWAKLQRRRWWPRWVALWFRGSECVTGDDGNWNFHLHVVLVLWGHRVSYSRLWSEWETAVGERSQIDIDKIHSEKMHKARRSGGIASAAAYIVKYVAKGDELAKIDQGPGAFAHYASSMKRLRAFACGGAAPVLRRMAGVLLPTWARRLEWAREGVETRSGVAPVRAEEVDPETGEAWDIAAPHPCMDERERAAAAALAGPLLQFDQDGGGSATVGTPCGRGGRWRRLGRGPVRSSVRTVGAHEKGEALDALHTIIAGGDWRIFDEADRKKDGGIFRYRVVLPGVRFAWRDVNRELWRRLATDQGEWARRRRAAWQASAAVRIGDMERLDSERAILECTTKLRAEAGKVLEKARREESKERMAEVMDPERAAEWKALIPLLEATRTIGLGKRNQGWAHLDAMNPAAWF